MASQVTWQAVAKLIDESGPLVTPTTQGKVPKAIQKKIDSYQRGLGGALWTHAEHEILAMIAAADLMWERTIRGLSKQDENALLQTVGANLFSATDTARSRRQTQALIDKLGQQEAMCSTFPSIASAVVGKSALGGPLNASQIGLNTYGRDKLKKVCARNIRAIDRTVERLRRIDAANYRP